MDDVRAAEKRRQLDAIATNAFAEFKFQKPTKAKTLEGELIEEFRTLINAERVGTKWKPLSYMAVRSKLAAIANDAHELQRFMSECKDYQKRNGSFSKRFFGGLK